MNVQRGTINLTGTTTSAEVSITAVPVGKSFVISIPQQYRHAATRFRTVIGTFGRQQSFTTLAAFFKDVATRFRLQTVDLSYY